MRMAIPFLRKVRSKLSILVVIVKTENLITIIIKE